MTLSPKKLLLLSLTSIFQCNIHIFFNKFKIGFLRTSNKFLFFDEILSKHYAISLQDPPLVDVNFLLYIPKLISAYI